MRDQHGVFQNIKSVQLENKAESQHVRDEEGRLPRDVGRRCDYSARC